jgi:hypothetical protein
MGKISGVVPAVLDLYTHKAAKALEHREHR